jgi:hypothetical protein
MKRDAPPVARRASGRLRRTAPLLALLAAACTGADGGGGGSMAGSSGAYRALHGLGAQPQPEQLLGLNAVELDRLLGPADFRRSDGLAEMRQYRDTACVLDVFLYADSASDGYRVTHVEARDRGGGAAEQACVSGLLRDRGQRAAG